MNFQEINDSEKNSLEDQFSLAKTLSDIDAIGYIVVKLIRASNIPDKGRNTHTHTQTHSTHTHSIHIHTYTHTVNTHTHTVHTHTHNTHTQYTHSTHTIHTHIVVKLSLSGLPTLQTKVVTWFSESLKLIKCECSNWWETVTLLTGLGTVDPYCIMELENCRCVTPIRESNLEPEWNLTYR